MDFSGLGVLVGLGLYPLADGSVSQRCPAMSSLKARKEGQLLEEGQQDPDGAAGTGPRGPSLESV